MTVCTPDVVLARSDRLSWRVLAGEAIILFPESGTLHRLNETGTRVWEHIDGRRSLAAIAEALSAEYNVVPDVAAHELVLLADELLKAGLAEVCS